jgi:hypothetical protein
MFESNWRWISLVLNHLREMLKLRKKLGCLIAPTLVKRLYHHAAV